MPSGGRALAWVLAGLLAAVCLGQRWSPSSYALALREFDAGERGLLLGTPRPIRSDEWAVVTPLTQAAVNSGFSRHNATSYYGEDLRIVYGLPLRDWGLAFKPTLWPYLLGDPALAFSFHHLAVLVLFLAGHVLLLERLGLGWPAAALLTLAFLFGAVTQYWWTTQGPALAFFPIVLLGFLGRGPLPLRLPGFAWCCACWLITYFYPPLFIGQAFLAVVLVAAHRPELLRRRQALLFVLAAGLAVLIAAVYLRDELLLLAGTSYPGQRRVGGGEYGMARLISHFLPGAYLQDHESLLPGVNICDLSVLGSHYLLLVACFLDHRRLFEALRRRERSLLVLLGAVALLLAWLLLPLPSWAGWPLLWNLVPARRMSYVLGVLLLLAAHAAARQAGLRLHPLRALLFAALVVAGWVAFKLVPHGLGPGQAWRDLFVLVPLLVLLAAARARPLQAGLDHGLLAVAVLAAVVSFGDFNPLQDARPIFERPSTRISRALDDLAATQPIAVEGFTGAVLNGWGYASASHVLSVPQLARFRQLFPELPPAQLDAVFNRYAHLVLSLDPQPRVLQEDAIAVPRQAFVRGLARERSVREAAGTLPEAVGGHLDIRRVEGRVLELRGWAPWSGLSAEQGLEVHAGRPLSGLVLAPVLRPDVVRELGDEHLIWSGFHLRVEVAEGSPEGMPVCLVATDRGSGLASRVRDDGLGCPSH